MTDVRARRLQLGVGLRELSARASLNPGTLSRWERGQRVLAASTEARIHKALAALNRQHREQAAAPVLTCIFYDEVFRE